VGLFDRLKAKTRGIMTAAEPAKGVPAAPEADVRARLLAISGQGIQTGEEDGDVVVAWAAKVASAGIGGGDYEYLYRAIRLELDESDHEAKGICLKTTTNAEIGAGGLLAAKNWEKGQHVGSEKVTVLAWLGPHYVEGGATEQGYEFHWSDLRDPVIAAVTGAGWTYKPKTF
jgi:hypothetical protein